MTKKTILAMAALAVFVMAGCAEQAPAPAPAAPKEATKEVQSGQKNAQGLSPDALTVPGDGKGNFGSKSGGN
ncbi:MAG: hypothetical protein JSS65_08145 [Armatimonadetes bacterium]|nr:hypothetical protein [Armatimonadota bacterium]